MSLWSTTSSFIPWDDQLNLSVSRRMPISGTGIGIDTSEADPWRQGNDLKIFYDFARSAQPKIWGGEILGNGDVDHTQDVNVHGQSPSFTDYEGNRIFNDLPKFSTLEYVKATGSFPLPIYFNDGPQANVEASIEVFTLLWRRSPSIEWRDFTKGVRGEFMEGSPVNGRLNGNFPIIHSIEYKVPSSVRPFLDEGEMIVGISGSDISGAVKYAGFSTAVMPIAQPFDDTTEKEYILKDILTNTQNTAMTSSILRLDYSFQNDIRPFGHRAATAGYSSYGPNAAVTGTDSIAFINLKRGS